MRYKNVIYVYIHIKQKCVSYVSVYILYLHVLMDLTTYITKNTKNVKALNDKYLCPLYQLPCV